MLALASLALGACNEKRLHRSFERSVEIGEGRRPEGLIEPIEHTPPPEAAPTTTTPRPTPAARGVPRSRKNL
jgi:hypothetical protein